MGRQVLQRGCVMVQTQFSFVQEQFVPLKINGAYNVITNKRFQNRLRQELADLTVELFNAPGEHPLKRTLCLELF